MKKLFLSLLYILLILISIHSNVILAASEEGASSEEST